MDKFSLRTAGAEIGHFSECLVARPPRYSLSVGQRGFRWVQHSHRGRRSLGSLGWGQHVTDRRRAQASGGEAPPQLREAPQALGRGEGRWWQCGGNGSAAREEFFQWWDTLRGSPVTEGFTVAKRAPSGKLGDAWWPGWVGSLPEAPAAPRLGLWGAACKRQGLPGSEGPVGTVGPGVPSLC